MTKPRGKVASRRLRQRRRRVLHQPWHRSTMIRRRTTIYGLSWDRCSVASASSCSALWVAGCSKRNSCSNCKSEGGREAVSSWHKCVHAIYLYMRGTYVSFGMHAMIAGIQTKVAEIWRIWGRLQDMQKEQQNLFDIRSTTYLSFSSIIFSSSANFPLF